VLAAAQYDERGQKKRLKYFWAGLGWLETCTIGASICQFTVAVYATWV